MEWLHIKDGQAQEVGSSGLDGEDAGVFPLSEEGESGGAVQCVDAIVLVVLGERIHEILAVLGDIVVQVVQLQLREEVGDEENVGIAVDELQSFLSFSAATTAAVILEEEVFDAIR